MLGFFVNDEQDPPAPLKKRKDNTSKKKLKKRKKEAKEKTATVSTTDPEFSMFVKGDHKRQMACEAHTVCDVYGVVPDVEVTPGNVYDSVHAFMADSAFKPPHICKLNPSTFGRRIFSTMCAYRHVKFLRK